MVTLMSQGQWVRSPHKQRRLRTVTSAQSTFTVYYHVLSEEGDEGGIGDNLRSSRHTIVVDGYSCSFVFEDQPGAGDWAGPGGWVSWVDDAIPDAGSA